MREAGVEIVVDCAEISVVGFVEVARKMPAVLRAWRRLMAETRSRRPSMAILTDFPGFHVRLARARENLDGELAARVRKAHRVDDAHGAAPELAVDLVGPDSPRRPLGGALALGQFGGHDSGRAYTERAM